MRLFPDGFRVLLAPAAALPAVLPRLLDGLPVPVVVPVDEPVVPIDEPVVPVGEPVVVPVAVEPPAVDPPPAEPAPLCAMASVLVSASAVANPIAASLDLMILSLV
jgi:hypothetical protein